MFIPAVSAVLGGASTTVRIPDVTEGRICDAAEALGYIRRARIRQVPALIHNEEQVAANPGALVQPALVNTVVEQATLADRILLRLAARIARKISLNVPGTEIVGRRVRHMCVRIGNEVFYYLDCNNSKKGLLSPFYLASGVLMA